jgi:hypothetical protein
MAAGPSCSTNNIRDKKKTKLQHQSSGTVVSATLTLAKLSGHDETIPSVIGSAPELSCWMSTEVPEASTQVPPSHVPTHVP